MKRSLFSLMLAVVAAAFAGCSTYLPPSARADLQAFAPASVQEGFAAKPTNPFPASIAAVRIQAPDYSNYNLRQNGGQTGQGRYSVIMTREVEDPAQFARVTSLPKVSDLVAINRMLLPSHLEGDREIREAAARLHADLVFVYTFDTAFFDRDVAKPLSVITLGLAPTRTITASTTVSALLMDTRTGYIYSAYEVTERKDTLSTSWSSGDAADMARRDTEKNAFGKLVDELVASWPGILQRGERADSSTASVTVEAVDGQKMQSL